MKTEMAEAPPAAGGEGAATAYENDVILWAEEQARFLREGRFSELDIEHLADEIEDVGRSEKRELASRMAVLLAHLLKWRLQPEKRSKSWRTTIADTATKDRNRRSGETPSLKNDRCATRFGRKTCGSTLEPGRGKKRASTPCRTPHRGRWTRSETRISGRNERELSRPSVAALVHAPQPRSPTSATMARFFTSRPARPWPASQGRA